MIKTDHVIKIYSTSEIPANTIAELESYDIDKQAWKVKIPENNSVAYDKLVVTQNLLHNNGSYRGFGQYGDGFYNIKYAGSETLTKGSLLGSKAEDGGSAIFVVYYYDSNSKHAICRPKTNSTIKKAYCKTDAVLGSSMICYLEDNYTGEEITVNFSIMGGNALNSAIPRLEAGDVIFVSLFNDDWYCLTLMQASENCDCYNG